MKIGACAGPREWPLIAQNGYDFCEGGFAWLASATEAEFREAKAAQAEAGLAVACFNGFFPGTMKLYELTWEELRAYLECGFSRAAALGGQVAVLGSGGARHVPEGMEKAEALERFVEILRLCGDVAAAHGMKLAIEPLNYREDTLINTVEDALDACRRAAHPAVGVLIDFYHFRENGEDIATLSTLPELSRYLFHVHLTRPDSDRGAPTVADMAAMRPWLEALRQLGYQGRVSLECIYRPDFETAIRNAYPALQEFCAG